VYLGLRLIKLCVEKIDKYNNVNYANECPTRYQRMLPIYYFLTAVMNYLLQFGMFLDARNELGQTALHLCIKYNYRIGVKILLEKNADTTIRDNKGFSVLHTAIYCKNLETMDILFAHGCDINYTTGEGDTPLIMAIRMKNVAIVRQILIHGSVDMNKQDIDGNAPIHKSVGLFDTKIAVEFVDLLFVSSTNLNCNIQNDLGQTALHIAARANQIDVAERIIYHLRINSRSSPNRCLHNRFEALNYEILSKQGRTPLDEAVVSKRVNIHIQNLFFAGARANEKDKEHIPATMLRFEAILKTGKRNKTELSCNSWKTT
jgi:ankyrin repeat protein